MVGLLSALRPRVARSLAAAFAVATAAAAVIAAPPASLTTLSGRSISLSEGRGPVELIFVASWCDQCERELAAARRRLAELRQLGYRVVLVGVDERQDADSFAAWARSFGFPEGLVFDTGGVLQKAYEVELLPWSVVHGSNGRVVHSASRPPEVEAIRGWAGE